MTRDTCYFDSLLLFVIGSSMWTLHFEFMHLNPQNASEILPVTAGFTRPQAPSFPWSFLHRPESLSRRRETRMVVIGKEGPSLWPV